MGDRAADREQEQCGEDDAELVAPEVERAGVQQVDEAGRGQRPDDIVDVERRDRRRHPAASPVRSCWR